MRGSRRRRPPVRATREPGPPRRPGRARAAPPPPGAGPAGRPDGGPSGSEQVDELAAQAAHLVDEPLAGHPAGPAPAPLPGPWVDPARPALQLGP